MTAQDKRRLDALLVERHLVKSRALAQALIQAGKVDVNGQRVDKPGTFIASDAHIAVREGRRFVSRGGEKLEAAIEAFGLDPSGSVCLDVGASTGGFTDCLLQRGAARVYAVDVGKGLLDWRLRTDGRVVVREGLNARYLEPSHIGEQVELVSVDVAFISLRLVLPPLKGIVDPGGDVVALVKPQFEAGRSQVRRGGVVRDPEVHRSVLKGLVAFAADMGWSVRGVCASPLLGPAGNREFFLHLLPRPGAAAQPDARTLAQVVADQPGVSAVDA